MKAGGFAIVTVGVGAAASALRSSSTMRATAANPPWSRRLGIGASGSVEDFFLPIVQRLWSVGGGPWI